ncbi:hypothetical protein SLEP1_g5325 [Rubroshorea leprosula]|uniref:Uncharacterized protein n=1 Tax=Rubroshorea leprosula TaxID=152421 RepID=A0AAV5HXY1_9ROSI|nr:hypothetical protein SLEP1_g5325 [Rubroshorea leprosula]
MACETDDSTIAATLPKPKLANWDIYILSFLTLSACLKNLRAATTWIPTSIRKRLCIGDCTGTPFLFNPCSHL